MGKLSVIQPPKLMADALLSQAAPAQNTWYTVLDTTFNVRIVSILICVATTGEDLECRVTIDGNVRTATISAVAGTNYYIDWTPSTINWLAPYTTEFLVSKPFIFEARSIKVELRKTTAAGAGTLSGIVKYAKY